jgi:hypothetical protein
LDTRAKFLLNFLADVGQVGERGVDDPEEEIGVRLIDVAVEGVQPGVNVINLFSFIADDEA